MTHEKRHDDPRILSTVPCAHCPVVARGFQRTRDQGNDGGDGMVTYKIDKKKKMRTQPRDDRISSIQIRHNGTGKKRKGQYGKYERDPRYQRIAERNSCSASSRAGRRTGKEIVSRGRAQLEETHKKKIQRRWSERGF